MLDGAAFSSPPSPLVLPPTCGTEPSFEQLSNKRPPSARVFFFGHILSSFSFLPVPLIRPPPFLTRTPNFSPDLDSTCSFLLRLLDGHGNPLGS